MSSQSLEQLPVSTLKGVGPQLASTLEKLGIVSLQDLLFHLPHRYLDRTRITPIARLKFQHSAVVEGRVRQASVVMGKRRSLMCTVEDDTGVVTLRFFHFNASQKDRLQPGALLRLYGEPRIGATGMEFYHPEYDILDQKAPAPLEQSLTPIYGLVEGLGQARLRKLIDQGLRYLEKQQPEELLPETLNQRFCVTSLSQALIFLHQPPQQVAADQLLSGQHPWQQRLSFEELLAHYLGTLQLRDYLRAELAPKILEAPEAAEALRAALPFQLTEAQQRVIAEIQVDLAAGVPMLRMLQGDVGSGKTLVAAFTCLGVVASGYQVAVVAPTEILAEQHFSNFCQWLQPLGYKVAWLVGKLGAVARRESLADISSGEAAVVVGTHALFQDSVEFHRLGLAIIDEQHRFGVHQRLSLRKKSSAGELPHQLIMTATPIPRTLAMTAYARLDYSIIDELPLGRTPVNTVLISQTRREQVIDRVRAACSERRQVYWVCPLVEDSETLSAANAEDTSQHLILALAGIRVGLVHGRLKAAEKEAVMSAFKVGDIQLLVATTVIEVGVDVPNASLMIIENPERLGLAQLHQLRGRVGRGSVASHCVLMYGSPLSKQAQQRLRVLKETNDGFKIAEQDLALRGPGELLGTRQTGEAQYRLADLQRDAGMLSEIHALGRHIHQNEPKRASQIIRRWLGTKQIYGQV
ncbi:MAG: ATP-dependent DNA helicase RecG [Cellvibrionaceae bacterium]|nr:ATP-dependent DNA helicase RecG [Cellvibrionaceae bacterium]